MFCPLCQAEYREGFTECASCAAALVAADAAESERNPQRRMWVTSDRKVADRVFGDLREAAIPCSEDARAEYWVYAVRGKRPEFKLYILERDAEKARNVSGVEFGPLAPKPPKPLLDANTPKQICPFCAAEFVAGTARCPDCDGDLLAWQPGEASEPAGLAESAAEIAPPDGDSSDDDPELVWRGGDPVTFSRVVEVLRENQILHHTRSTADHLAFAQAMPRPKLEIRVRASAAAQALELLQGLDDSFPLVPQEPLPEDPKPDATAQVSEPIAEATLESAEFNRRRVKLRWGLGLLLFSSVLFVWILYTGPLSWASRDDFLSPAQGVLRLAAIIFLGVAALLANVAAVVLLCLSWTRKADKMGLLSLFLALQGVLSLFQFAYLISR